MQQFLRPQLHYRKYQPTGGLFITVTMHVDVSLALPTLAGRGESGQLRIKGLPESTTNMIIGLANHHKCLCKHDNIIASCSCSSTMYVDASVTRQSNTKHGWLYKWLIPFANTDPPHPVRVGNARLLGNYVIAIIIANWWVWPRSAKLLHKLHKK